MDKYRILLLLLLLLLAGHFQSKSQVWEAVYSYDIPNLDYDYPKVDVSASDIICVSYDTRLDDRVLLLSDDGGNTWDTIMYNFLHFYLGFDSQDDIYMISYTTEIIEGVSGPVIDSLYYSDDLGETWALLEDVDDYTLPVSAIHIDHEDQFYLPQSGSELLVYSDDQLVNDIELPFDIFSSDLQALHVMESGRIVLGTEDDGVYYSDDTGNTWVESLGDSTIESNGITSFCELESGRLLASLSFGGIEAYSDDEGETWTQFNIDNGEVHFFERTTEGVVYAFGQIDDPEIWYSDDDGENWESVNMPGTSGRSYEFDLSDDYVYLMLDSVLYRTETEELSVGVNFAAASEFNVYPNPFSDAITIQSNLNFESEKYLIQIFDASGKLHKSMNLLNSEQRIDLSGLESGVYIVNILNEGSILNQQKIVRQ